MQITIPPSCIPSLEAIAEKTKSTPDIIACHAIEIGCRILQDCNGDINLALMHHSELASLALSQIYREMNPDGTPDNVLHFPKDKP